MNRSPILLKHVAILGLLTVLLMGCDKDDRIALKAGEKIGQQVTDFTKGIGKGMDQKIVVQVALSPEVLALGLTNTIAQSVSGLYEITAGSYSECCGLAGTLVDVELPNVSQKYVKFSVDPGGHAASMTFLAEDARTVFSRMPCARAGVRFTFDDGLVSGGRTVFRVNMAPPPYFYWDYVVTNTPSRLHIHGQLGARIECLDVPTQFIHSNVVAMLVSGPRLTLLSRAKEGSTRLMVQGRSGWTDIVEASADLKIWTPISTNLMDYSLCPICPFATVEDKASTNFAHRFYRAVEYP